MSLYGGYNTHQVVTALQASRQAEGVVSTIVREVLVGPLAVDVVALVNLEPAGANTSLLGGVVDGAKQEVGDGAWVRRDVPVDGDAVALVGGNGVDARGDVGAVHVAGNVVTGDIGL